MLLVMQHMAKWCWAGDAEDHALRVLVPPGDFGTISPTSALPETETNPRLSNSLSRMALSFPSHPIPSHPAGGGDPILELIALLADLPPETPLEVAVSSMKL